MATESACQVSVLPSTTVDLVCQYYDTEVTSHPPCVSQSMRWQAVVSDAVRNLSHSTKYGEWTAAWGLESGHHVSLLRIRALNMENLALYRCEISCVDAIGETRLARRSVDICFRQPRSKYHMCSKQTADDNNYCSRFFNNGACDAACDSERHLYDGIHDCARAPLCNQEAYCTTRFSDGVCDKSCNSEACLWDGGDCNGDRRRFANDTVVLTLARTQCMCCPKEGMGGAGGKSRKGGRVAAEKDEKIYLKLDNTNCKKRCFRSADSAAKFLSMALTHGWKPGLPITTVTALEPITDNRCPLENNTLLHIRLEPVNDTNIHVTALPRGGSSSAGGAETWLIAVAAVCSLLLLVTLAGIAVLLRRMCRPVAGSRKEKHSPHHDWTHTAKNGIRGTHV
ncbi:hypothetical protein LSAT2_009086 [Lamellibrachia satsuma]|nr:hypothetical protein LSAT2_009086 [Lamellibrachia satsuma]